MKRRFFLLEYIPILTMIMLLAIISASLFSHSATVFSESKPFENRHCIIIDAGHGGEDGGATSCSGVLESEINLQFALRLDPLFQLLGYPTHMIRTTDTAIHTKGDTIAARKASDLKERVRIANETENGLLISIHQNYYTESQYSGAQVFYPKTEGSSALAGSLQEHIRKNLNPGSNRREKPASGVYLMDHITCPAVLIECGFLSNPEEEAKLRSEKYQKHFCCLIAATVSTYFAS